MTKNKTRKNFIWNSIGLTFNAFNSLFFLIVVKLINGIDIAGIFTYSYSLVCLLYFFSIYYNRIYQVSDSDEKFNFNQYLTTRVITSLLSVVILLVFSLINGFDLFKTLVIILLMIFRAIEAISDCIYGQIQRDDNLYKVGISYTLKGLIGLMLFIIFDLITKNILISIGMLILVNLLLLLTYDYKSLRTCYKNKIEIDYSMVKKLLIVTFPIFAFSFLQNYLATNQKYVLNYYLTDNFQTIYGILVMPATLLNLIGTYLILPFVGELTSLLKNKKIQEFKNLVFKINLALVAIGTVAVVVAFFIGIPVLNIVYSIKLDQYKMLLMLILIAAILNGLTLILSSVLTVLGINKEQIYMFLASSIVSTILSVYLISTKGIEGAAYSYILSYVFTVIVFIYNYYKYLNKKIS